MHSTSNRFSHHLVVLILSIIVTFPCIGQSELGTVKINARRARLIQTFLVGDSVFYSFNETQDQMSHNRAGWIVDGQVKELYIPTDETFLILNVAGNEKMDCMYFVEGKGKNQLLRALIYDKSNNYTPRQVDICPISGKIIGSFSDNSFYLFAVDKLKKEIIVYRIKGSSEIDEKHFKVTNELTDLYLNETTTEFFSNQTFFNNSAGAYPRKFILEKSSLYFVGDRPGHKGTIIFEFNLINGDSKKTIIEHREDWTAFISNGYLYSYSGKKVEKDRIVYLKVFEPVTYKEIYNSVFMTRALPENIGYSRQTNNNQVGRERRFNPSFSKETSFIVSAGENLNTIRVGSYNSDNSVVVLNPASLVTLAATAVASVAVNALQTETSYFTYWYLAEKKDHSSIFLPDQSDKSTHSVYQKIDEFEMANMNSADLKQVFYAGKKNKIIATYYLNTELRFVKFE